jgi:AcrR family transcriptional regulator
MVRARYKKSVGTQARILDAAETLFANQGFEATTTRQITALAEVRNASVNYYFATKRDLAVAVIDRRFEQLKIEREVRLEHVNLLTKDTTAALQGVVAAFVIPLSELSQRDPEGWRNYNRIVAQIAANGRWNNDSYFKKIDELAEKFVRALAEIFPEESMINIVQASNFMLGATLHAFAGVTRGRVLKNLSTPSISENPEPLIRFISAGLFELIRQDI